MNAASIVSVITAYGVVFLYLLALYVEKGERPFRRTRRGFRRPFDVNLSLLPRLNWRLLPDGGMSVFWHEHTSSNSLILTWHNALYNRDASCPTNFQAELFADGRFDYRYPDRTVRYAPVFPFDWDGDGLENSVDPDPLAGGLEIKFSKKAVIFEDEYRNTEDGPLVPKHSTTTRLTISASGGTYGGSFSLTLQNLDKLALVDGAGSVSPVTSKMLAPYETYYATFECEGVEASGEENDVKVDGMFTEAVTWRTETPSAEATVVRVELETVFDAPENHRQDRHVYGVGEQVKFKVTPAIAAVKIKAEKGDTADVGVGSTDYDSFGGSSEVDGSATRVYTCPIASTYVPDIIVSYSDIIYVPLMEIVEPQEVITPRAEWDGGCFPTFTVGEAGMYTYNYIGPMYVSFQGIAVSEIPCNENDAIPPTGYFTNIVSGLYHGTNQCSNMAMWIKDGNYWMKDSAYSGSTAGDNWTSGVLIWKIPVGWHRKNIVGNGFQGVDKPDYERMEDDSSRPLLIGGRRDLYLQRREILSDGTFRSEKFGRWITRGTWCRIVLDGSTKQWFRFH